MPLRLIDLIITNKRYPTSSSPPINPQRGYSWTEVDVNGDIINDWFWNGTYWLGEQYEHLITFPQNTTASTIINGNFMFSRKANLFIKSMRIVGRIESAIAPGGTVDSSANYYTFSPRLTAGGSNSGQITNAPTLSIQGRTYGQFTNIFLTASDINSFVEIFPAGNDPDASPSLARGLAIQVNKVGATAFTLTGCLASIGYQFARVNS